MTAANILLYIALIGYVLYRKMQGQPLKQGRRLFILPVLMIIIGYGDLTHGHMKSVAIAVTVIGAIVSLTLGAMRGQADRLSTRDGVPFVQWTRVSLALFAANIIAKLVIDVIGVAAGSTTAAVGKSLIFTLGLTLLAEAIVLLVRSGQAGTISNRAVPTTPRVNYGADAVGRSRRQNDNTTDATSIAAASAQSVADAIKSHHQAHRDRHQQGHEDHPRRDNPQA